ncbi:unnamed protein product [Mucor hiemalis]
MKVWFFYTHFSSQINMSLHRLLTLSNVSKWTLNNATKARPFFTSKRNYIRPHYYANDSLSNAINRQKNPIHRIGRVLNNMDPNKVLWGVIGTNVGIYFLWQFAINSYKQFGDDGWLNFMVMNFMNSPAHLENGNSYIIDF